MRRAQPNWGLSPELDPFDVPFSISFFFATLPSPPKSLLKQPGKATLPITYPFDPKCLAVLTLALAYPHLPASLPACPQEARFGTVHTRSSLVRRLFLLPSIDCRRT